MKEIHEELTYPRAPEDAFSLISTGAFQVGLITHLGGLHPTVVEETHRPDGSVRLVTRQETAVELPGFARKLIPAHATVIQTYEWEPPGSDGVRRGTWTADTKAAPMSIGGPTELRPDAGGSRHVFLGEVRASVPMIGGRLESFALDHLKWDLAETERFTVARLTA